MYKGRQYRDDYDDSYEFEDIERGSSEDAYRRRAAEQRMKRSKGYSGSSKNRKNNKKWHPIRIIINLLAIAAIIYAGIMIVWHVGFWDKEVSPESNVESKEFERIQVSSSEDIQYILVCGFDESKQRTDVNMLVCWNLKEKSANILQIPRDTYMGNGIHHSNDDKFNATYENPRDGESQPKAVCRKINSAFGLPVDHYVMISLNAFKDIVDSLGGVEVDVVRTMSYRGVTVYPGTQVLDGKHAEVFMRYRHGYAMGDTSRVKMQRKFYAGLMEKAQNMSITQLISVLDVVNDELVTDMTYGELKSMISKAQELEMKKVKFFGLPGENYDFYLNPSAKTGWTAYYTIHINEYAELANKYFNPDGNTIYAEDLDIKQMSSVDVSIFEKEDSENDNLSDYKESTAQKDDTSTTDTQ